MISSWRAARLRNDPNTDAKTADNTLAGENRRNKDKSHLINLIRIYGNHVAAVGIVTLAGLTDVQVGKPLPPIMVRDKGKTVQLNQIAQDASVAIVFRAAFLTGEECDALKQAIELLAGNRVRLLPVNSDLRRCASSLNVMVPVEPAKLEGLVGQTEAQRGAGRLVVVDPYGVVRLVKEFPAGANGIAQAATIAANWEGGRQSFITNCGHCHGDDGADTGYAGLKTLAGISRRLTGAQILDGGQQFGAVDMSIWSQSVKDRLLLYIQGL